MKQKLFLSTLTFFLILPISLKGTGSIEGRWIVNLFEGDPGNTMYEFVDGLRYTYYCDNFNNGCDSTYWSALDTSDAIPNPDSFTFLNDTLSIGSSWQRSITFECDGNIVSFSDTTFDEWWRIGLDTNECENQQLVVFTKQDSADWTLPENQDRIADSVWITRKHNQGIFNIAQEDGYSGSNGSPLGTLWASTSTENAQNSDFTSFVIMHGGNPQSLIDNTISLYLPEYERYFDLVFLSFSGGNSGGGFSYTREEVFPDHLGSGNIEGRWISEYFDNTMYEFNGQNRLTYYCNSDVCDSTYWSSLDTSDAIPGQNPYTFINDTLTIDLHFGNISVQAVTFLCDGNVIDFNSQQSNMFRIGTDFDDCEDYSGQQLGLSIDDNIPKKIKLNQNYPNPFNPITSLSYTLLKDELVNLIVYDMKGRMVKTLINGFQTAGKKSVQWNATNHQGKPVSAGVYLYKVQVGAFVQTKKMILLK